MSPDAPASEQPAATSGTDFGLTADEQAAYDSMRSDPAPTGDPGHVDPEAPPAPAPSPEPAAPAVREPGAPAAPIEADEDDDEPAAPAADGTPAPHPKRVSYNKYARLEAERKADRDALAAEREKNTKAAADQARLDERLRLINEALSTPAPAAAKDEDPEPDPEVDIFGHNQWLKRQLEKTTQTFSQRLEQIESGRAAETSEQQLASAYTDDAQRFASSEPNFVPAYSYLMQVRTLQLANFHFGKDLTDPATPPLTPQEIGRIKGDIAREEKQLVGQALKAGKSPAQAVYAMARMTGYRPPAPAPAPAAGAAAAPNGATPPAAANGAAPAAPAAGATPPAANGAAKPSVKAEIDRIKSGQEAALSLSQGGGAPAPVLNAQKLADMPQEEFGELLDRVSRGELARIMGGA